jgi:hypothetical protein
VKSSAAQSDDEVAAADWAAHVARNKSFVQDEWYGQVLQKITCSNCHQPSRTAQAFNVLFLNLPTDWLRTMYLVVFGLTGNVHGLKVAVKVDRNASLAELVAALCATVGPDVLAAEHVRLVDLHGCRIFSTLNLQESVKSIRDVLYAYRIVPDRKVGASAIGAETSSSCRRCTHTPPA